jgi:23S rRNA (cytidine1920-2'-O)/16S rRNA (cytidine1409-2'-O)-methyltransferase
VKPQFEAGRAEVSRGKGVIREPAVWREALIEVASALSAAGTGIMGAMASPLRGAAGNVEFFLHAAASRDAAPGPRIESLAAAAIASVTAAD